MRQDRRIPAVLPVRISGICEQGSFRTLAYTLNVSEKGALLSGVDCELSPDTIIEIHRGTARGRFRVVWLAQDSGSMQVGVECVQSAGSFWQLGRRLPGAVDEFLAMLDRRETESIFASYSACLSPQSGKAITAWRRW